MTDTGFVVMTDTGFIDTTGTGFVERTQGLLHDRDRVC